ncbi:hypothetical protein OF83DRAFT_703415 [Amylostereum chailletii]|nr:hypothetical protein OF83DRAFT_703415 [Amylostereum chailletii]
MSEHECRSCHQESGTRRCSGCQRAWYCSEECQQYDWVCHIFDCNPSRPITTADHLALAIRREIPPDDPQTRADYGFEKAITGEKMTMLLGLYFGLMDPDLLGVKPHTLHKWRVKGILVQEIKNTFEGMPPTQSKGGYYPWFLENQHLLQDTGNDEEEVKREVDAMFKRAWLFMGRSAAASREDIIQYRDTLTQDQRFCFNLWAVLLSRLHPPPSDDGWIQFGFCGCSGQEEERELSALYTKLINSCTFDEFCASYSSSSLLTLFQAKQLSIESPFVADVLRGPPHVHKSVWDLKAYIVSPDDDDSQIIPSVAADYGFMNCKTPDEKKKLEDLYKGVFALRDADPLKLHEACIGGRLLEYLSEDLHFQLKPKKLYKRLLRNPYPLRDYDT